jgi:hypothetical protein
MKKLFYIWIALLLPSAVTIYIATIPENTLILGLFPILVIFGVVTLALIYKILERKMSSERALFYTFLLAISIVIVAMYLIGIENL